MPWENPGAVFYDTLEDTNQKASDLTKENDSDGEYFECSDCDGESEYDFVNSLVDDKKRGNFSSYLPKDSLSSQSASSIHAAYNRCPKQPSLTDTLVRLIEMNFEETLLNLATQYSSLLPHVLYSVLKGRPVVVVSRFCEDYARLRAVVDTLGHFVPNSFHTLNELIENGCTANQQGNTDR